MKLNELFDREWDEANDEPISYRSRVSGRMVRNEDVKQQVDFEFGNVYVYATCSVSWRDHGGEVENIRVDIDEYSITDNDTEQEVPITPEIEKEIKRQAVKWALD